ncbi:predicted protein [Streptomyces viridosporus ATCC 14672]|uniref:Predicted protein n=1 Tax=Streptomyces viridosporus (strain ATCC 14672 / DSM 40746 / JCM 4963 / KCTC 9882 / NRRL B-12104 / FH 1290) TaxID=566461 RepID=D6A4J2_STRV1|nr:hypothetical protein [Streptomyces viridosporus]EFE65832.1 predicted protein [Streptomyces viridosporus ATCC 14672]
MAELTAEDIAALREQGDLKDYLLSLVGRTPVKPAKPALSAVPDPGYRIAHVGGWPLGTAASGPTPPPAVCTCAKCGGNPGTTHQPQEGSAA